MNSLNIVSLDNLQTHKISVKLNFKNGGILGVVGD